MPVAPLIDRDSQALLTALKGLGQQNWLGLRIATDFGGSGFSATEYFLVSTLMARASGALAFLQTQHQSAGSFIATGSNSSLKQSYLPPMASGQQLVGIGFSHLRRPTSPLQARATPGGYRLFGEVPWVTGDQMFTEFVAAATLESGEAVFGLLPLMDIRAGGGQVSVSEPMTLAALGVTRTVRVAVDNWLLPEAKMVDIKPAGWIDQNDRRGVLKAASFALGCAQAGLDVAQNSLAQKDWQFLRPMLADLQAELDDCLSQCLTVLPQTETSDPVVHQKRQLRATAVALAGRCAHAAIVACGGAANGQNHPAQRIYREVLVFTISGQSPELAAAIMDRLSNPNPSVISAEK